LTPIEKNIIVVDEQGNEYEATYPKRAKGLVKNGRARFINETKICLACPPNEYLEDNKMDNNIQQNAALTEKEIFDQIVLLQKQLTEYSPTSLHRLGEAIACAGSNDEDEAISEKQVEDICAVFAKREETLSEMLHFYQAMYYDVKNEKSNSEEMAKQRTEFLEFIQSTTVATAASSVAGTLAPGLLPDFEKIWKTVFLGQ